jgi:crotonobetainyl-CoA:carnitine CoA-transferase CaiB-like acyl-CoA transferase
LNGVKVLDLTWFGAGPIAMRTIAGLGADVVRVETENRPDGLRIGGPRPVGSTSLNVSGYYNNFNADKRSITIDLTKPEGQELGHQLVAWADIMMSNMTARAIRNMGMTWEQVHAINTGIFAIYQPMQGMTGPHAEFGGFGAVLSTICGSNYLAGYEANAPVGVGTNYPDYVVTPLHAVTGEGQLIDMSQLESSVAAMSGPLFVEMNGGPVYERRGNRHPTYVPHGAFKVRESAEDQDRWLAIACTTEEQWRALCGVCSHPEWADDPRFATREARQANEDALESLLAAWAAEQPGRATLESLQAAGVPAGLVLRASDVLADRHLKERGYFVYLDHPEAGLRAYDGSGFHLSKTPVEPTRAAPLLGEHTFDVAIDVLGLSMDRIADLVASQVLY